MIGDISREQAERLIKAMREAAERDRPRCGGCIFYRGGHLGECCRNPPAIPVGAAGGKRRPSVSGDDFCGEFVDRRTGERLLFADDRRVDALRARVAELEERIERMRE